MNGMKSSGIPMGGLGTGSVELRQDGLFHEWFFMNNKPWAAGVELDDPADVAYFGINVKQSGVNRSALLCTPLNYDKNLNDPYALPFIEYPKIKCKTRFPFTKIKYNFNEFPLKISLNAFNSFIPLDVQNSSIPNAFFEFEISNTSTETLEYSFFMQLRNLCGYTKQENSSKMQFKSSDKYAYIAMSREDLAPQANDNGEMVYGVKLPSNATASYAIHTLTNRNFWEPLFENNCFENRDFASYDGKIGNEGDSSEARTNKALANGALAITMSLKAGESTKLLFNLSWFFPNFHDRDYPHKSVVGSIIGNHYSNYYCSGEEVFKYSMDNFKSLYAQSKLFSKSYFDSDLPMWVLEAVAAQLTTLAKSSWFDKSGNFGIWEGLGCCGLQTTDITYYGSHFIIQFFPQLQKSQMRLTRNNIEITGKIPHMMPGNFSCCDVDHRGRIDLIPQYVLLIWRDMLWHDDRNYIAEMYPSIKESLTYFQTIDKNGDGLPENSGPDQTYDQFPLRGTSAFVGYLYAASLKAASQIAEYLGDESYKKECLAKLQDALEELEKQLWNGEYYRLSNDTDNGVINEGIMVDQLSGDWFLAQSGGESLIAREKMLSALGAIWKNCRTPQGYLRNCAWRDGDGVKIGRHTANQADWPWSGTEYAFAGYLLWAGLNEEGIQLTRDVWERYERTGLRFNHIECGQHYYRAMSSWAIYLSLTKFSLDHTCKKMSFNVDGPKSFIFGDSHSWGTILISDKTLEISIKAGNLSLSELQLWGEISIIPSDEYQIISQSSSNLIKFKNQIYLNADKTLKIDLK